MAVRRLSVLDQSVAIAGRAQAESIRETIALAKYCEDLGYSRFWVAEHHNHDTIAGSAPEIVMSAIAATTERIRIGSAGVMLPHYSALKVAEQFRVLDAIAPGRIDLGLGRAPGSDGRTAYALNPNAAKAAEQFPAQVRDLLAWISDDALPEGHPFGTIRAFPTGETVPEMWMLGTSDYGAQVAAHFGIPYCFAHFITEGRGCAQALALYRENYQPSQRHPEPETAICVWALLAETDEEAHFQFMSRARSRLLRDQGQLQPIESPEMAAGQAYTPAEQARLDQLRETALVGTPDVVGRQLRKLVEQLGVEEISVLTWTHGLDARKHSYKLLANEFEIGAA